MEIMGAATKVTVYIGESDRWGQKPLYMAILEYLKAEDCAGATVTRGVAGFGAHSRIRSASIVDLSADLPLVIEWVDAPARVARVMPRLVERVVEGLITCQPVEVVAYSHRDLRALPAAASVRDVMSREVVSIAPITPIAEAVELLIGKAYRALPVVDADGRVMGILTDGDLLARLHLPAAGVQRELTQAELAHELAVLRASGQVVSDLMTAPVVTVRDASTVADAVRLMVGRRVKRLPVVGGEGRLLGVVSRVDVLRALAQPIIQETPEGALRPGLHAKVGDVMTTAVQAVRADAPLNKVADLLVTTAQRRVVVIDAARCVLGIITDGDLLSRAAQAERPGLLQALVERLPVGRGAKFTLTRRTAADVMTRDPLTVRAETPLLDALRVLLARQIKRLPVVDAEGRLVGLVGRGEILQALAQEL